MKSRLIAVLIFVGTGPSPARPDGGTLRLTRERAGRQISVFTSPTPLRVGPVDVSVLIQESPSGRAINDIPIRVKAYPRVDPDQIQSILASTEAATNKLMQAAHLQFTQAGTWHVAVVILKGADDSPGFGFDLEVAEALPAWVQWGVWIGLPYLAVALYLIHQGLAKRRRTASGHKGGTARKAQ